MCLLFMRGSGQVRPPLLHGGLQILEIYLLAKLRSQRSPHVIPAASWEVRLREGDNVWGLCLMKHH